MGIDPFQILAHERERAVHRLPLGLAQALRCRLDDARDLLPDRAADRLAPLRQAQWALIALARAACAGDVTVFLDNALSVRTQDIVDKAVRPSRWER